MVETREGFNNNTTSPINKEDPFRGLHEGIDFCRHGANVSFYSLSEGVVIAAGGKYNQIIVYDEKRDVTFVYLHANSVKVKVGQRVYAGETELGIQGNKGCKDVHVHVEVHPGKSTDVFASLIDISLKSINPYVHINYYLGREKTEDIVAARPGVNPTKQEAIAYIAKKANEYAIPVDLALAVAWTENKMRHFKEDGTSGPNASGDYGLMQINIQHKKGMTNEKWNKIETDWRANIDYGLIVLKEKYK